MSDTPTASVQWKGTDVCMDLVCPDCGHSSHFDGFFGYYVECPGCKQRWKMGRVQISRPEPGEDCRPCLFDDYEAGEQT